MTAEVALSFPPFRLDLRTEQLWREDALVPLRPKQFAVLAYLASHPERLVTTEELYKAVWPDTYVSDGLLRSYIRQVRQALGDEAETPRFIETVPRRGYRFVAAVTAAPVESGEWRVESSPRPPRAERPTGVPSFVQRETLDQKPETPLVGRESELHHLHQWLAKAASSTRQVVFVSGEPGIGKTTLVDTFLFEVRSQRELGVRSQREFGVRSREKFEVRSQGEFGVGERFSTPNSELPPTPRWWMAEGRCIEHYGSGEAYLPILQALGQLCRQPGGEQIVTLLSRYAPTWLVQMPALVSDTEFEALQRKVQGATRERMLREMAEALEALTAEQPLVLVLEDVHWSDHSTLDLLSMIAQRRGPARLLLLATYRPADVVVSGHPLRRLKQELQARGYCEELPLGFLTTAAVDQYLTQRFPQHDFPSELGRIIHQSTEGNPLFMVNVVDEWVRQEMVIAIDGRWRLTATLHALAAGVPESLRQMIEKQLERLTPEEQRVLEAASVIGGEFTSAAVAASSEEAKEQVERCCEGLAQRAQFVRIAGTETYADGTITGRYRVLHALYPQVLYERLTAVRRIHLHRRIGEWLENAYSAHSSEKAAELALHFERGQNYARAVHYCHEAGQHARQLFATAEAARHFRHGLALLPQLPETRERQQHELSLLMGLGMASWATNPEVGPIYTKAHTIALQLNLPLQSFLTLSALQNWYIVGGEVRRAKEIGQQTLALANELDDPVLQIRASATMAVILKHSGELRAAYDLAAEACMLYETRSSLAAFRKTGQHSPLVAMGCTQACALWCLGYPAQALEKCQAVLQIAEELRSPFDVVLARGWVTVVHQWLGDVAGLHQQAEAGVMVAAEHRSRLWEGIGRAIWGLNFVQQEQQEVGWAQLQQSERILQAVRGKAFRAYVLALRAEAHLRCQQLEAGLTAISEALAVVEQMGERLREAELYRIKGELLLARDGKEENQKLKVKVQKSKVPNPKAQSPEPALKAEDSFLKAIEVARQQQAKSWELRAVMSLVRLRQSQVQQHVTRATQHEARTRLNEAHSMLSEIYNWFTEGFDTRDLQEAKALLEVLERAVAK